MNALFAATWWVLRAIWTLITIPVIFWSLIIAGAAWLIIASIPSGLAVLIAVLIGIPVAGIIPYAIRSNPNTANEYALAEEVIASRHPKPTPAPYPPLPTPQITQIWIPSNPYLGLYKKWDVRKRKDGLYSAVPLEDGVPRWQVADQLAYEDPVEAWTRAIDLTKEANRRAIEA